MSFKVLTFELFELSIQFEIVRLTSRNYKFSCQSQLPMAISHKTLVKSKEIINEFSRSLPLAVFMEKPEKQLFLHFALITLHFPYTPDGKLF